MSIRTSNRSWSTSARADSGLRWLPELVHISDTFARFFFRIAHSYYIVELIKGGKELPSKNRSKQGEQYFSLGVSVGDLCVDLKLQHTEDVGDYS